MRARWSKKPARPSCSLARATPTRRLIRSIPRIDKAATRKVRLEAIAGVVPKLIDPLKVAGSRLAANTRSWRAAGHATAARMAPDTRSRSIFDLVPAATRLVLTLRTSSNTSRSKAACSGVYG